RHTRWKRDWSSDVCSSDLADDARVAQEADALERGDFDAFLKLVQQSGESAWMYLQNIAPVGAAREQAMAVALATAAHALQGRGAARKRVVEGRRVGGACGR